MDRDTDQSAPKRGFPEDIEAPRGPREEAFEEYPLSRPEYISALVHLYRGELDRANIWRTRLDTSTNWALVTAMGLLSFAFNKPANSHAGLLVAMVMVISFLTLEARRYRFFDMWRNRVRMIEENFYGPILTRDLDSPKRNWGLLVASDLLEPRFKITYLQALRARLVRNYLPLFALLLVAWVFKVSIHPVGVHEGASWQENMALGHVSGWVVLAGVVALYLVILGVIVFVPRVRPPEADFWSPENPMDPTEVI